MSCGRSLCLFVAVIVMALPGSHGRKFIPSFAGPYIAYGDKYYMCPDVKTDGTWKFYYRNTHFNPMKPFEKMLWTGNVTANTLLDDSCWGEVTVAVRSNNQWKENAMRFKFPLNACSAFRDNIPSVFKAVFQLGNATDSRGVCRVPPGEYVIDHEPLEFVFPNFPVLPYGTYLTKVMIGPRGSNIPYGCLATDCKIIPRPS